MEAQAAHPGEVEPVLIFPPRGPSTGPRQQEASDSALCEK
jgi:hypothetical protein